MKRWTKQEEQQLSRFWKTNQPAHVIARELGRNLQAVYVKAHKLGLTEHSRDGKTIWKMPNRIKLTNNQKLWLKLNYPHMRTEICATILGVSYRTCVRLARKLGVEKTAQFMRECQAFTARKARESHIKNGTYPKKGYYSPNLQKGKQYQFKPQPQ